jgi:hypothetical protein
MKKKNRDYKTMTDAELEKELDLIDAEYRRRKAVINEARHRNLNIKGFTCKDVAVRYGDIHGSGEPDDINFQFYLKKDGKLWDFYYGKSDWAAGDWWPESEEEYSMGPHFEFIPSGFSEAMENCYEFRGTVKDAIKRLKDNGITDVKPTEEDPGGGSGEYAV